MRVMLVLALAGSLLAGCVKPGPSDEDNALPTGLEITLPGGVLLHNGGARAGTSYLHLAEGGGPVKVTFPEGVLVQDAEGRLLPPEGPVEVPAGGLVTYLPPWGLANLTVGVEAAGLTHEVALPLADGSPLVSGDLAVELLKVQRDQFPHRSPGNPSYEASITYFADFFKALGYDVEVDRYGGGNVGPLNVAPDSLSSVVAYKRGASDRIFAFGGHFDVVEETRDGAFDNTAGTVATMAVAKAFQNVTTEHTLMFALWGGEEDGILGSQWWVSTHPQVVPLVDAYVNFDVTGIAYPAPKPEPAPIVLAAGPDGPIAQGIHAALAEVESKWLQSGAPFQPESVAREQATGTLGLGGAGVNAQSDHTPFMARGIPVLFQFTGKVDDVFGIIHSDVDTVDNLTKYALLGIEGIGEDVILEPAQIQEGEQLLARSFETQMYTAFYWTILMDAGVLPLPGAGGAAPTHLDARHHDATTLLL